MFKKISAKLHLPLNRFCCKRVEHINVKESSQQNIEVIEKTNSPVTFVTHKHLDVLFIMLSSCVSSGPVHTYPEIFVSANFFIVVTKTRNDLQ